MYNTTAEIDSLVSALRESVAKAARKPRSGKPRRGRKWFIPSRSRISAAAADDSGGTSIAGESADANQYVWTWASGLRILIC